MIICEIFSAFLISGEANGYSSDNFHATKDGQYVHFSKGCDVAFWDLKEGSLSLMMKHPLIVRDVRTVDWQYFITRSDDAVLRIWDKTVKRSAGRSEEVQIFPDDSDLEG